MDYVVKLMACAATGVIGGIGLIVILAAITAIVGRSAIEAAHGPVLQLSRVYLFSGLAGGIGVGLFHPIARWRLGVIVLGWIAAACLYAGALRYKVGPVSLWDRWDIAFLVLMTLITGTAMGLRGWQELSRERRLGEEPESG